MSQHHVSHDHDDIPRFEPWLGVMASSLVPAAVAIALPRALAVLLVACTVLLFVTGIAMLVLQSRRRARERGGLEPSGRRTNSASTRDRMAAEAE